MSTASYSRASLAGLFRSAHVGLVTPLRDGMNLVAKEYVAAQDPEDPGVLVLSRFAGAAAELDGALIVNPHELEAMAEAIGTALEMPLEERKERHARMFAHLVANDIDRWAERFLVGTRGVASAPRLSQRPATALHLADRSDRVAEKWIVHLQRASVPQRTGLALLGRYPDPRLVTENHPTERFRAAAATAAVGP